MAAAISGVGGNFTPSDFGAGNTPGAWEVMEWSWGLNHEVIAIPPSFGELMITHDLGGATIQGALRAKVLTAAPAWIIAINTSVTTWEAFDGQLILQLATSHLLTFNAVITNIQATRPHMGFFQLTADFYNSDAILQYASA
jgi:hypothetical protein